MRITKEMEERLFSCVCERYFSTFLMSILERKKKKEIMTHRKVTIPDEFVHECQSFIFFLFSFSYSASFVPFSYAIRTAIHSARCIFESQRCIRRNSRQVKKGKKNEAISVSFLLSIICIFYI